MRILDWSDEVGSEDFVAILPQFQAGVQSIDLSVNTAQFLVHNSNITEFGVSNDAERIELKAVIAVGYTHNSLDIADINIVGIEGVLVGSCAVTGTDDNGDLTNTYHLTKQIFPATTDPVGTQDLAYMVGVILGDMFYYIEEQAYYV